VKAQDKFPRRQSVVRDVAADIERRIKAGEWTANALLPPVRALSKAYGVATLTVQRAIALLREAGYLRTVPRAGTFVAEGNPLDGVVLVTSLRILGMAHDRWAAFGEMLVSVQAACADLGIPLVTATERDNPKRFGQRRYGFLFVPSSGTAIELERWHDAVIGAGQPYVSIGYDSGLRHYLGRDDLGASRKALQYLTDLGHRDIALFPRLRDAGRLDLVSVALEGVPDLRVRTYPVRDTGRHSADGMRKAFDQMLESRDRPTAICCGVDAIVMDLLDCLAGEGTSVPEECSVLGYCRKAFATWEGVPITRLNNPRGRIAALAVAELVKMAAGASGPGRSWITPEIVEGATCAPISLPVGM